jgi:hypothetical protein
VFLNGTGGSRKDEKMCKTTQEVGSQKRKGQSTNLGALRSKIRLRVIAEELNINRETVRQIVKEDLAMRKISAKMVPRILTHDQKQRRLHISFLVKNSITKMDHLPYSPDSILRFLALSKIKKCPEGMKIC